jgi:hypothetical protein
LKSGSVTAIRSIDIETTTLTYTCEDGKPCASKSLIESLERLDTDEVRNRKADVVHAAKLFGYIVPKYDKMVFKTQEPHPIDGKPGVGQECAIVARKSMYMDKLLFIGQELRRVGAPDLGLTDATIQLDHAEIKNAGRGCTYLDLILRYCDATRAGKKRWFFRPIAAYWAGLRGVVSKTVKAKLSVAERELKTGVPTGKKLVKPTVEAVPAPVVAPILKKLKKPTAVPAPIAVVPEPSSNEAPPPPGLEQPTVKKVLKKPTVVPEPIAAVPEPVPREAPLPPPVVEQPTGKKVLKKPTALPAQQPSIPSEKPCSPKDSDLYLLPEHGEETPATIVENLRKPLSPVEEEAADTLFEDVSEENELLANAMKQQAEEEARKKVEEEARRLAEEEDAKRKAAEEEAKQKTAEENAKRKAVATQANPAPTVAKLKPLGKPSTLQKPKPKPKVSNENDYV